MFLSQLSTNELSTGYICLEMVLKWKMPTIEVSTQDRLATTCQYLQVQLERAIDYKLLFPTSKRKRNCVHPSFSHTLQVLSLQFDC